MASEINVYDDDIDYLTAFDESDDILAPDGDEDASRHLRWLRKARTEVEEIHTDGIQQPRDGGRAARTPG